MKGKSKSAKPKANIAHLVLGVILVVVGAIILLTAFNNDAATVTYRDQTVTISQDDVDEYVSLAQSGEVPITEDEILDQLIQLTVVKLEAQAVGVEVTEQELQNQMDIQLYLLTQQLSEEQLDAELQRRNLDSVTFEEQMRESVYNDLLLNKLLISQIYDTMEVSDETLQQIYLENKDQYVVPKRVGARHILICHKDSVALQSCLGGQNRTKQAAIERTSQILALVSPDNFADIAGEYSEGPSFSKGGDLGVFASGAMTPDFEDVAFSLDVGEIGTVETQFGYHIILVYSSEEESFLEYEDVKSQLAQQYKLQQFDRLRPLFIAQLVDQADVSR